MLRTLEYGYGKVRSYGTQAACEKRVQDLAAKFKGAMNARIVMTNDERYTAVFSCFENIQDAVTIATFGFIAHA